MGVRVSIRVRVRVRVRVGVWVRVSVAHECRFGLALALAVADGCSSDGFGVWDPIVGLGPGISRVCLGLGFAARGQGLGLGGCVVTRIQVGSGMRVVAHLIIWESWV